jgi:hypothetical protein
MRPVGRCERDHYGRPWVPDQWGNMVIDGVMSVTAKRLLCG